MAAIYFVEFDDNTMVSVSSADAKSMKQAHVRESYRKARKKAEAKHARQHPESAASVTRVRCVG